MHYHIQIFVIIFSIQNVLSQVLTSAKNITGAHSGIVIGVVISSDQSFFVTAGADSVLKKWSTSDYSLLNSKTYSSAITALNIDLTTNYIYVCTQNSDISVIDPSTFAQLNPTGLASYPNSGNGNSIVFKSDYSQFYLGGSSGSSSPSIYDFSTSTYANLGSTISSTFTASTSIISIANLADTSIIAADNENSTYIIGIYLISDGSLQQTLTDSQNTINSVHYDSTLANIFSTATDNYIRIYTQTNTNSTFQQSTFMDVSSIGTPYVVSADISGYLYAVIGPNLVQFTYNSDGTISISAITIQLTLTGQGQSMIISSNLDYILVGCQNGDVNIFNFPGESFNIQQIVIIACFAGVFAILIPFMIKFFFCKKQDEVQERPQKIDNITMEDINPTVK